MKLDTILRSEFFFLKKIPFIYMCVFMSVEVMTLYTCGGRRTTSRTDFSSSTVCFPKLKLNSSDLVASMSAH